MLVISLKSSYIFYKFYQKFKNGYEHSHGISNLNADRISNLNANGISFRQQFHRSFYFLFFCYDPKLIILINPQPQQKNHFQKLIFTNSQ